MAKILSLLLVFYCFFSYELEPYFLWDVYNAGLWGIIHSLHPKIIICGLILIVFIFSLPKNISKQQFVLTIWSLTALSLSFVIAGPEMFYSKQWMVIILFAIYLLSSEKVKRYSYDMFHTIFPLLLIVPILVYILLRLGINVPYSVIQSNEEIKIAGGIQYRIYPFAAQWIGRWNQGYYLLRFCGVFREPGVVGTFSALLLCSERFRIKKDWRNIVLLISGCISFSLAFYGFVGIYFLTRFFKLNRKWIIALIGLVVLYLVFINVSFPIDAIARFQERLRLFSSEVVADNRTNSQYDLIYNSLFEGRIVSVLFGNGYGSIESILAKNHVDGASYKNLIFNFGLVGFIGQIAWLFYFCVSFIREKGNKYRYYCWVLVIIYLANMYQRPSYFGLHFIIILFGAFYKHCTDQELVLQEDISINERGVMYAGD